MGRAKDAGPAADKVFEELFVPADFTVAALRAHGRRVCALAGEIARRLRLPPEDTALIEQAALAYHWPADLLRTRAFDRLLADLRGPAWPPVGAGPPPEFPSPELLALLTAGRAGSGRGTHERTALPAQILEIAAFFADRIEFLPFEFQTVEQILDELDWMAKDGLYHSAVVLALAGLPRGRGEELIEKVRRFPVYPAVAMRVLELSWKEDADFSDLERLASSDQVLAGHLIEAANSALMGARRPIATIRQAMTYIGLDACRKVLMATAFRPLFASVRLHHLWRHSLDMGQRTARLAQQTRRIHPGEAFLAGLVHDVGRLAFEQLARSEADAYARMLEKGCDPLFAEVVLSGADHGACGAEVLRSWAFPPELIEAVQRHHQPEQTDSLLAALLYVAEFLSGSEEAIVSRLRLRGAEEKLGLTVEQLADSEGDASESITTLLGM